MTTQSQLDVASTPHADRAIATMTMAFSNDPIVRWVFREASTYLTYWPPLVEAFGGRAFSTGTADSIADCGGVALAPARRPTGRRDDGRARGRGRSGRRPGRDLRLPGPDGRVPPQRIALVSAAHGRRCDKAALRLRLSAAAPCARALRPGSAARLSRGDEPAEQGALRAPRLRSVRCDSDWQLSADVADAAHGSIGVIVGVLGPAAASRRTPLPRCCAAVAQSCSGKAAVRPPKGTPAHPCATTSGRTACA